MPKKPTTVETTTENLEENAANVLNESPGESSTENPADAAVVSENDTAKSQTDHEMDEFLADEENADSDLVNQPDPLIVHVSGSDSEMTDENQSDGEASEVAKKPRRVRKTAANADEQPQSDTEPAKTPRRRARQNNVVSIDERRSVETSADKHNNDLLDLVESLKSKKILSGTIQGVERSTDNPNLSYAVIYHGDFKVIIPADEVVEPPEDFRDRSPGDVMHYMITKRLGAEVDFIVKGVDKAGIAAASRLEAMAAKRKEYYFGTDRDGNNLLYEGIDAEARVVSVIRAGIFVDLFGLETYIPLRELSYQRGVDAAAQFQPGQRVLVKVLSIDRSNRNKIQATASVKQASENPYEKALRKYVPGSRYEMEFAKNVSTRIMYMDEGGIYEEGTPSEIFDAPKREKTRAFIKRIKSFRYEISTENFDFIELTNSLLNFCTANALTKSNANKAGLLSEELTVNLIPKADLISVDFSFPDSQAEFTLTVAYDGEKNDVTQNEGLAADIVRGIAGDIKHEYDGVNRLYIKW